MVYGPVMRGCHTICLLDKQHAACVVAVLPEMTIIKYIHHCISFNNLLKPEHVHIIIVVHMCYDLSVFVWMNIYLEHLSYAYLRGWKTLHRLPSCCEHVSPQIVDIGVCTGSIIKQTDESLNEAKHRRRRVQMDEWLFRGDHESSSDVRECTPGLPCAGFGTPQKLWCRIGSTKCVEEREGSTSTFTPFLIQRVHMVISKVFARAKANPYVYALKISCQRMEETSQYNDNIRVTCCHKYSSAACVQSMSQVYAHLGISFLVTPNCHVGWASTNTHHRLTCI